jgi:nickel-dependent lactate racemase
MKCTTVRLPQLAWHGNGEIEMNFPAYWKVDICNMKGYRKRALSRQGFRRAFSDPIGTRPIRELARGKKEVVILFDDMTRPTRVAEIVPYVLEELRAAGVADEGIRFIAAVGAHGALTRVDFVKKLGEDVVCRFPVFNHNPYENCTFLGNTSRGTPVYVNSEVMSCDFKIGIGGILPHPLTGFSGGGKIILPGVAGIDTMEANHRTLIMNALAKGEDPGIGLGNYERNFIRLDMAEAAKMAGLDIKIDAVFNLRGETVGLFVGDPVAAHVEGMKLAREVYATKPSPGHDIVVLNAYAKANEVVLALPVAPGVLGECSDVVLIANAPEGQVTHYLVRSFGNKYGGRLWSPPTSLPANINRLIVLTPYIDIAGTDWLGARESIIWAKKWDEVLQKLIETHGEGAKVAIVPDATMQYFVQ